MPFQYDSFSSSASFSWLAGTASIKFSLPSTLSLLSDLCCTTLKYCQAISMLVFIDDARSLLSHTLASLPNGTVESCKVAQIAGASSYRLCLPLFHAVINGNNLTVLNIFIDALFAAFSDS